MPLHLLDPRLVLASCLALAVPLAGCSSSDGGGNKGVQGAGANGGSSPTGGMAGHLSSGTGGGGGASLIGGATTGGSSSTAGGPSSLGGASGGGAAPGGAANDGGAMTGGAFGRSGASGASPSGGVAGLANGGQAGGVAGGAGAGGSGGALTCGAGGPVTFSANVRLNDDTGMTEQNEVALATGPEGLAVAGWMDNRANRVCAYSVTTDGGATWKKNVSIPNVSGEFVGDPAVAIDGGGTIYAVCQEYLDLDAGTGNIRLMTSSDKGATWSAVKSIQSAPDKPWAGGGIEEGTVFVSWLGKSAGIKRSVDGGATWGTTQSLGNIIHGTAIVTSTTGLVHVPYNLDSDRNQLRYLRSTDGGATWEKTRDLLADMGRFCFECSPRQHPIVGAAADPTGRNVAITWTSTLTGGEGDDDVWVMSSKDGGDTWSKPLRVNDNATKSRQLQSWVGVDRCNRVHVAWTDLRNGKNEVWYARAADPTQGFEPNVQVTDGSGTANRDFIGDFKGVAVLGSDVLVVWTDTRRDGGDIYFSRAVGAAAP
jgi:hypothetical protein